MLDTISVAAREVPAFHDLVTTFYTSPFATDDIEALRRIHKASDTAWRAPFRVALSHRFDRVFQVASIDQPEAFNRAKQILLNILEDVEAMGSTGFLNQEWLTKHAQWVVERLTQAA